MAYKSGEFAPWATRTDGVLLEYNTALETGLSDSQVMIAKEKYGINELDKEDPTPLWQLVLEQFDDTLVKVLLIAAAVSFTLALTGSFCRRERL